MKNLDLTKGKPLPVILKFAIPLMLGDLFQQLYNATDTVMVGKFAGDTALAAVSSTTFLIRLVIGLFIGISTGASVIIAQCKGANDNEKLTKVIHTLISLALIGGIGLTMIGILITRPLLHFVSTPPEVMGESLIYLRTYFSGILFSLVYNVGSSILCSFGDSRHPFIYLSTSSVVNIVLDYVFIRIFHWGVFGTAFATVIAQLLSAIFVVYHLMKSKEVYAVKLNRIKIDKSLVPEILKMGLPAGIQSAVIAFSNVCVQGYINVEGAAAMSGFGVFNKVDGIIMLPLSSIALAMTTYTAQNYGARNRDRIKEGVKAMLILQAGSWIIGCVICLLFGKYIFTLFTNNKETIDYAFLTMRYMIPLYWSMGVGYSMTCMIRGIGKSKEASLLHISAMCLERQLWIKVTQMCHVGITGVLMSYPFSWVMTIVSCLIYVAYIKRKQNVFA